MSMKPIRCSIFLSIGLIGLGSSPAHGVGYRLPNQDPVAIARGNAFTATADNPSAIYYNPAGITQLEGQNLQMGLYTIAVNSSYRAPNGSTSETEFEVQGAPQFYYAFSPKESPFSFGLGLCAPYGLGLEWPDNSGFRTLTLEARLAYASFNPVVAWQVHPTLSLGIGPTLNVGIIRFRQGILKMDAGDEFDFRGNGVGAGFNAGLLWQPQEQWSFGVSYRSATDIDFNGRSEAKPYAPTQDTSVELHFPQFVMAGVSYRPTKNWNIEVDVDWADWDSVNSATFNFEKSLPSTLDLNFKSGFMYELGVTRYLDKGYFVSAGYFFSPNSVPDRNFVPAVPDTDQHSFSVGIGRQGERWSWAATYQLLTGPWRTVHNTPPSVAEGRYKFFNNAVNVSVGYHF
jgi:long-chain fatty acid transport protein